MAERLRGRLLLGSDSLYGEGKGKGSPAWKEPDVRERRD